MEADIKYLRYRVVKFFDAGNAVVTDDLPHLHQSAWHITAMQPGNPSNSALGAFTIPLHPPGSDGYAAAKPIYDLITRHQRVEAYISHDGASLGKLAFAGIILEIDLEEGPNPRFELRGQTDLALANLSRPFPGEFLSNDTTDKILKSYLGTNEMPFSDTFGTFSASNYTATNLPGLTAGSWSATTDDGFNVVTNSTGTGAVLLSKNGGGANDRWHTHYVEVTGRVTPSTDSTRAAEWGIGISLLGTNVNDCVLVFAVAKKLSGRYVLDAGVNTVTGGVLGTTVSSQSVLMNADDPNGNIPYTIGLLWTLGGNGTGTQNVTFTLNGKIVLGQIPAGPDPGTATRFPFLYCRTPNSGVANYYFMNLAQFTRFTTDGPSTAAAFGNGTISTSTNSMGFGVDPGPTFLDTWTRLATRENRYWRYTPQPYVVGTRTIGTVDFAGNPGADLSSTVIYSRRGDNLVGLALAENEDRFVGGTAVTGQSTPDGGGIGYWNDIGTMVTYGVRQDESLSFTHADFNGLRRGARQIVQNKISIGSTGAKTAVIRRDPQFTEQWRELDSITVDAPEINVNKQKMTVLAYDFTEGSATQTVTLDQYRAGFSPDLPTRPGPWRR